MKKSALIILLCIATLFLVRDGYCDTIHMKNQRILKGVIKEETDKTITIDIGIGKVTVNKNDVESIEKANSEEQANLIKDFKKKNIERGTLVPPSMTGLSSKFQELKNSKNAVDAARSQLLSLRMEFEEKRDKYNSLMASFNSKNIELKNLDPNRDIRYYNRVISDINSLSAKLSSLSESLRDLSERGPGSGKSMQKAIVDYSDKLYSFKTHFDKELEASKGKKLTEDEACFYEAVDEALQKLEKNLKKDSIALSRSGGGLIVEVKLNDKLTCIMVVDTGASSVTISKNIADRLGMDASQLMNDIEITLADGSQIMAKSTILKSVQVGDSRAEDVMAVVTDTSPGPGLDGLLGMTFLNNFGVKVDSANNRLILETVK